MHLMAPAQVKTLLIIASAISGYPVPANAKLPVIQEVTPKEMSQDACEEPTLPCPVIGFFDFETGAIEVEDSPNAGHSVNSIAVHELTHWLQFQNWERPASRECPREYLREYQAYLAGFEYERIYEGKVIDEFQTPGVVCDMPI